MSPRLPGAESSPVCGSGAESGRLIQVAVPGRCRAVGRDGAFAASVREGKDKENGETGRVAVNRASKDRR